VITVTVGRLREALRAFTGLRLTHASLPVLGYLKLHAADGVLSLTGTDLDHNLTYRIEVESEGDEGIGFFTYTGLRDSIKGRSAGTLLKITLKSSQPLVLLEENELVIELCTGESEMADFPRCESMEGVDGISLSEETMTAIMVGREYCSTDVTRLILHSVLLYPDGVVGTDGRRLYLSEPIQTGVRGQTLIPGGGARALITGEPAVLFVKTGESDGEERVVYRIDQGKWSWTYKKVEGTYPNHTAVIPKDWNGATSVQLSQADITLLQGLGRLPVARSKEPLAGLRRRGDELLLMLGQGDESRVYPLSPDSMTGEETAVVTFNFSYLLGMVAHGARTVMIQGSDEVIGMHAGDSTFLLMPMRCNVEESDWETRRVGPRRVKHESAIETVRVAALNGPPRPVVVSGEVDRGVVALLREIEALRATLQDGVTALGRVLSGAGTITGETGNGG
jgi:DNA polymerase-3 subunit beta